MVQLSQDEYANLETYKRSYSLSDPADNLGYTYIDTEGGDQHVTVRTINYGTNWGPDGSLDDRRKSWVIEIPTVNFIMEGFTPEFTTFIHTLGISLNDDFMIILADWTLLYALYYPNLSALNVTNAYMNTTSSVSIDTYIEAKISGLDVDHPHSKNDKERATRCCQNFSRAALVFTTDIGHPKHKDWVHLVHKMKSAARTVSDDPSKEKTPQNISMDEFNARISIIAKEAASLLLPGETF